LRRPFVLIATVVAALFLVGSLLAGLIARADEVNERFVGAETFVLTESFSSPGEAFTSFTVRGIKPFLYPREDTFDAMYNVKVRWDGNAVAAAYVPIVLDTYIYTAPGCNGRIVVKRPSLIGLMAVFRGSEHRGSFGGLRYVDVFKLEDGWLHIWVRNSTTIFNYTASIVLSDLVPVKEAVEKAWLSARENVTARLRFIDLTNSTFELAKRALNVRVTSISVKKASRGYIYTITFSIPVWKVTIEYLVAVNVTEVYKVSNSGGLPLPISRQGPFAVLKPSSMTEVQRYRLVAGGIYVIYSYIEYETLSPLDTPYLFDALFNANGTTGMIIFRR
jgi:hypothetical protein